MPQLVSSLGNFEPKELEDRDGPGEKGAPHYLQASQQNDAAQSESDYGMNIACSDEISLGKFDVNF